MKPICKVTPTFLLSQATRNMKYAYKTRDMVCCHCSAEVSLCVRFCFHFCSDWAGKSAKFPGQLQGHRFSWAYRCLSGTFQENWDTEIHARGGEREDDLLPITPCAPPLSLSCPDLSCQPEQKHNLAHVVVTT